MKKSTVENLNPFQITKIKNRLEELKEKLQETKGINQERDIKSLIKINMILLQDHKKGKLTLFYLLPTSKEELNFIRRGIQDEICK